MPEFLKNTGQKLFGGHLEFRARLFNILAFAGTIISLVMCVTGIITEAGFAVILTNLAAAVIAAALLWYTYTSGKYQLCYVITVVFLFLGLFTVLFFGSGGYHSGMPSFFIFAVLFTVFMIEGKKMVLLVILELALYTSLFFYAFFNPGKMSFLLTETDLFIDTLTSFLIVSVSLAVTMSLHFRLYNQRQKELVAARMQVEEYARMKSELFAEMSHEMRTPLTVMSAYAQFAVEQIREAGANEQTLADLATISDEARRLAEMADGTLKILMNAADTDGAGIRKNIPVDTGDLASRLVRLLEPMASRRGCKLTAIVKDGLPLISGDADAFIQLLWNLLQNAITHSQCTSAVLTMEADGSDTCPGVKITVNDDGVGIDPGILPHIFERGVSGIKGGSGLGLSICREIAIQYGGDISVESEPGAGTRVAVLLRGTA